MWVGKWDAGFLAVCLRVSHMTVLGSVIPYAEAGWGEGEGGFLLPLPVGN